MATQKERAALEELYRQAVTYYETTPRNADAHTRGFALGQQGAADKALEAIGLTWQERYEIWLEVRETIRAYP